MKKNILLFLLTTLSLSAYSQERSESLISERISSHPVLADVERKIEITYFTVSFETQTVTIQYKVLHSKDSTDLEFMNAENVLVIGSKDSIPTGSKGDTVSVFDYVTQTKQTDLKTAIREIMMYYDTQKKKFD